MFHLRRRRGRREEEARPSLTSPRPPSSLDQTSLGFISAVMGLQYRPKISLENLARAEREFIGEGYSFRVEKAIVETPGSIPQVVVTKRPLFSEGEKTEGSHWNSLLLEVKALMHPPLAGHTNIVDLLAIGWEAGLSDTSPELAWPVLVMPYATHGTLDVFQRSHEMRDDEK